MSDKKTVQYADLPKTGKKVSVTHNRIRVTKDGKRSIRTCVMPAVDNDIGETHTIGVWIRCEIDADTDSELKFGLSRDAAFVLGNMLREACDDMDEKVVAE